MKKSSLGIGVTHHQFRRQLYCRQPAVRLLAQRPRNFPMNRKKVSAIGRRLFLLMLFFIDVIFLPV
jgi:hypothetical protein